MASSYCRVTLIGHVGRPPELRHLPSGDAMCGFTMATTERWRDHAGAPQERTTWFRVGAYGRLAEVCCRFVHVGSCLYLEGPLWQQEYTDRDGVVRTGLEVRAREVRLLDPRPTDAAKEHALPDAETAAMIAGDLDDVPF